jgi:cytochrome P450
VIKLARQKIALSDIEYRARPFEAFGRLRELGAIVPARFPFLGNLWLVTTYEAVNEVLKNDKLFCRDPRNAGKRNFLFLQLLMPGIFRRLSENMIGKDEPDHRRLRSLVDQAFQRQSILDMQPRLVELAQQQLDKVAHIAAENGGEVDLIEHFARELPLAVICELLGLPAADRPKFKKSFSGFANIKSIWGIARVVPGLRKTLRYLREEFARVRREPRAGLITALVEAEQEGDRLSDDELQSMVMLLLLAGHETTVHLISNSILTLLQQPEAKRTLLDDWSQSEAAVEEILRYNSPAQFAKPRFVTEDTEFHGQPLRRGEMVMPVLAAANTDPARFDNPTEFQIDRARNYHLGFGAGPHVCLALKLARAETQVALEQLFTRWPNLQPAFELSSPDWSKRIGMRAINSLRVVI